MPFPLSGFYPPSLYRLAGDVERPPLDGAAAGQVGGFGGCAGGEEAVT
jgi:hypothetical protein